MRADHIVLCGTAGSGKSTIGLALARALGRPFVDIDRVVERAAGTSVSKLFVRDGEPAFRARERAAIGVALASAVPGVIALGGGALEDDESFAGVQRHTLVWLCAPVATLAARVGAGTARPLLAGDPLARLRELAARREARYRAAHLTIDAAPPARAVVAAVLAALDRHAALAERA